MHAFDVVDEVTTAREENHLEERYEGDFKYYSLGEYSDKASLRSYLSSWFSGEAIDYVINIYSLCGGLSEDENGRYELVTDGSSFGDMQEIDLYKDVCIMKAACGKLQKYHRHIMMSFIGSIRNLKKNCIHGVRRTEQKNI